VNVGGAILWSVEITRTTVGLRLVAFHVNYSHVALISGSALGLRHDVVQVDVILEEFPLPNLLATDTATVTLSHP
jgi:hypothetical protein